MESETSLYHGLGMKLIVGLGNPGIDYEKTRHNAGFLLIDDLISRWNAVPVKPGRHSLRWECRRGNDRVFLLKPLTYMNLSGQAVQEFLRHSGLGRQHILIAYDDVSIDVGQIRIRPNGSHGGQKGLKHILDLLGDEPLPRLRIGVGPYEKDIPLTDFVLSEFSENDQEKFELALERACQASEDWLKDSLQSVMNRYNANVPTKNSNDVEKTTPIEGGE